METFITVLFVIYFVSVVAYNILLLSEWMTMPNPGLLETMALAVLILASFIPGLNSFMTVMAIRDKIRNNAA